MKLKDIALVAMLATAVSTAWADDQDIVLTQMAPNLFSAAFSTTETQSGLFVDTFTFSLPAGAGSVLGSGMLSFSSSSGLTSLVVASLGTANGISVPWPSDVDTIAIPSALSFSGAMAPLTLTVLGFAGDPFADTTALSAGYSGSVTFNASVAAVPEPGTVALMLAGLGMLGWFVRGRKTATSRPRWNLP